MESGRGSAAGGERAARQSFTERFGVPPARVINVPGWVELLGCGADDQAGLWLAVTVDRYLYLAVGPRLDGRIKLIHTGFAETEEFFVDQAGRGKRWATGVREWILELRKRGLSLGGLNGVVHSEVAGCDPAMANVLLVLASGLAVREYYPFRLTRQGIAPPPGRDRRGRLPGLAREEAMAWGETAAAALARGGVEGGTSRVMAVLFGAAERVSVVDVLHARVDQVPMPGGLALVTAWGAGKELVGCGRGKEACRAAAAGLGVGTLRGVRPVDVKEGGALGAVEVEWARYVTGENARVVEAERALRTGDGGVFSECLWRSHRDAVERLGGDAAWLELSGWARELDGCLGVRGAGGEGWHEVACLVEYAAVGGFVKGLGEIGRRVVGKEVGVRVNRLVDGVVSGLESA